MEKMIWVDTQINIFSIKHMLSSTYFLNLFQFILWYENEIHFEKKTTTIIKIFLFY